MLDARSGFATIVLLWAGGGPELLPKFDANDVCTSVRWMHTP